MKTGVDSKLAQLRTKTDHQLARLLARQLERTPTARACEEIRPLVSLLPHSERRSMEKRLAEVAAGLRAATHDGAGVVLRTHGDTAELEPGAPQDFHGCCPGC